MYSPRQFSCVHSFLSSMVVWCVVVCCGVCGFKYTYDFHHGIFALTDKNKSRGLELNQWPTELHSDALPTELPQVTLIIKISEDGGFFSGIP